MNKVDEITKQIDSLNKLKIKIESEKQSIKSKYEALSLDDVKGLTYDILKDLISKAPYDVNIKSEVKNYKEELRLLKYPELKHAVFYPVINELNLTDAQKKDLDRKLWNTGATMHIIPGQYFFTQEECDMLMALGIFHKYYCIICPSCGSLLHIMDEEEITKRKRLWELIDKYKDNNNTLSYSEDAEFNALLEQYDDSILYCYCLECEDSDKEFEFVIHNAAELDQYVKDSTVFYKLCMQPDRTYQNV